MSDGTWISPKASDSVLVDPAMVDVELKNRVEACAVKALRALRLRYGREAVDKKLLEDGWKDAREEAAMTEEVLDAEESA